MSKQLCLGVHIDYFKVYDNFVSAVYAVYLCSELYGQVSEDDTTDITAFSRISDAANRHVHFSKARTWRHCLVNGVFVLRCDFVMNGDALLVMCVARLLYMCRCKWYSERFHVSYTVIILLHNDDFLERWVKRHNVQTVQCFFMSYRKIEPWRIEVTGATKWYVTE